MKNLEKKSGIKETLELLNAVQFLAVNVAAALKDGKINIDDLPVLLNLMKEVRIIIDGIRDFKEIPGEIGDIDQEEIVQLGFKIYEIIRAVKKEIEK